MPTVRSPACRASFRVTARESIEMTDLSTNIGLLEEIATRSGGRVFTAEQVNQIPELLAARPAERPVVREWKLAESWLTLGLLLTLLSGEWIVRKLSGLP